MIGPHVSIKLSCASCELMRHVHRFPLDVFVSSRRSASPGRFVCDHAEIGGREIGETAATPAWCPVREDALGEAVLSVLGQIAVPPPRNERNSPRWAVGIDATIEQNAISPIPTRRAEFYVGAPYRSEVLEMTGTVTAIRRHGAEAELEIVFDGCAPRTVSVALNRVELPCIIG